MHLVRPVRPEQDAIGADDRDEIAQCAQVVRDAVVVQAAQVVNRVSGHTPPARQLDLVALLEPPDEVWQRRAAVGDDELEARIPIEEAVEHHARHR